MIDEVLAIPFLYINRGVYNENVVGFSCRTDVTYDVDNKMYQMYLSLWSLIHSSLNSFNRGVVSFFTFGLSLTPDPSLQTDRWTGGRDHSFVLVSNI